MKTKMKNPTPQIFKSCCRKPANKNKQIQQSQEVLGISKKLYCGRNTEGVVLYDVRCQNNSKKQIVP